MKLVRFCRDICTQLLEHNSLVVLGAGLGVHKIILALSSLYCDRSYLVFVLNMTLEEQEKTTAVLRDSQVHLLPKTITAETDSNERLVSVICEM